LFAIRACPPCHLLKEWRDGCAVPQRLPRIPTAWSALSRKSLGGRGTPSPEIGLYEEKQNTRRNIAECIHRIYGCGMFVTAGFIVGFDTEKASMGQPMIDFIEEANIQVCMVGLLYALPGIADAAIGQGRPPAQRP
jgi:hypothetical protein